MSLFQKLNTEKKIHRPKSNKQCKHNYTVMCKIKQLSPLKEKSNIREAQSLLPTCTRTYYPHVCIKAKKEMNNCAV